ncbi:hypothetical protein IY230_05180 [Acholeplasma laidlawii]|uniref:hypothetical protein n=1 Tax=Acholeplasma laidlawii TaxID=2148 RepID=UPI0018C22B0F|nr:hypothetical protein [Acholeplasma laidlawii]MBG0762992.1 hypothetical protein [Acholeplasma laidlawii]
MYRKYLYLVSLILQSILLLLFIIFLVDTLISYPQGLKVSDFIFAFLYLVILLLFTIYHYRSPYHEMKSAIYLAAYYFSPIIIIGLFYLLDPTSSLGVYNTLDIFISTVYGLNGVVHLLTIIGKEI